MAIAVQKFSKIFGEACPRTPLEPCLFLDLLQVSAETSAPRTPQPRGRTKRGARK